MRTPSLGAFFSKTNLLRWMINLLLLPPAMASATAYAQGAWQIDPNDSIAILSSGAGADTLQVGLAKVSGEVIFDCRSERKVEQCFTTITVDSGTAWIRDLRLTKRRVLTLKSKCPGR